MCFSVNHPEDWLSPDLGFRQELGHLFHCHHVANVGNPDEELPHRWEAVRLKKDEERQNLPRWEFHHHHQQLF